MAGPDLRRLTGPVSCFSVHPTSVSSPGARSTPGLITPGTLKAQPVITRLGRDQRNHPLVVSSIPSKEYS